MFLSTVSKCSDLQICTDTPRGIDLGVETNPNALGSTQMLCPDRWHDATATCFRVPD
jgi:hypothetical protein